MNDLIKMPLVYHSDNVYAIVDPDTGLLLTHEETEKIIKFLNEYINGTNNELIKNYNIERKKEIESSEKAVMEKVKIKEGYVYIVKTSSGAYKIGQSTNLKARIQSLKALDENLELIHSIKVKDSLKAEKLFHRYYKNKHLYSELFKLTEQDIELIKELKLPDEILSYII